MTVYPGHTLRAREQRKPLLIYNLALSLFLWQGYGGGLLHPVINEVPITRGRTLQRYPPETPNTSHKVGWQSNHCSHWVDDGQRIERLPVR